MRRLLVLMVAIIVGLGFAQIVKAEENVGEIEPAEVVMENYEGLPDPESRWFGLQMAWSRVSENVEKFLAFSEEKKADVEMKYLEREARIQERIELALERNPELATKLEEHRNRLTERYEYRVQMLEQKMEKAREREQNMEEKKEEWVDKINERKEAMEMRKLEYASRSAIRNRVNEDVDDEENDESESEGMMNQIQPRERMRIQDPEVEVMPAE